MPRITNEFTSPDEKQRPLIQIDAQSGEKERKRKSYGVTQRRGKFKMKNKISVGETFHNEKQKKREKERHR